jgi:hypothetical protein
MGKFNADETMHVEVHTAQCDRVASRDALLNGVMAAAYHDEKPRLMVVI